MFKSCGNNFSSQSDFISVWGVVTCEIIHWNNFEIAPYIASLIPYQQYHCITSTIPSSYCLRSSVVDAVWWYPLDIIGVSRYSSRSSIKLVVVMCSHLTLPYLSASEMRFFIIRRYTKRLYLALLDCLFACSHVHSICSMQLVMSVQTGICRSCQVGEYCASYWSVLFAPPTIGMSLACQSSQLPCAGSRVARIRPALFPECRS